MNSFVIVPLFVCTTFLYSCGVTAKHDVYRAYPKGSKLSLDVIKKSVQVLNDDRFFLVVVDISTNPEYYDPHILFYDQKLQLVSAAYFPSERIESLDDGVINGFLNKERNKRINSYRNDLPDGYSIQLRDLGLGGRSGQVSRTLIDSFSLDEKLNLALYVRYSDSLSVRVALLEGRSGDSTFFSQFQQADTLNFNLSNFNLDYRTSTISNRDTSDLPSLIWNEMWFIDPKMSDLFFSSIFKELKSTAEIKDE